MINLVSTLLVFHFQNFNLLFIIYWSETSLTAKESIPNQLLFNHQLCLDIGVHYKDLAVTISYKILRMHGVGTQKQR